MNPFKIPTADIHRLGTYWLPTNPKTWKAEHWARIRRTYIFERVSGLFLLPHSVPRNDRLHRVCKGVHFEHRNQWTDGIFFFLTGETKTNFDEIPETLPCGVIPSDLAPYCGGGWSSDPRAFPARESWLISTVDGIDRGNEILEKLKVADAIAPRWNFVGLDGEDL